MKNLNDLTKETNHQTRLLWIGGYWDGPISGMMLWEGQYAWYEQFDERWVKEPWSQKEINDARLDWEKGIAGGDVIAARCLASCEKEGWVEPVEYRQYKVYSVTKEEFESRNTNTKLWSKYMNTWECDENNGRLRHPDGFISDRQRYETEKVDESPALKLTDDKILGEFEY